MFVSLSINHVNVIGCLHMNDLQHSDNEHAACAYTSTHAA